MSEDYRDEARVEHMQRAIKKIRHHLAGLRGPGTIGRLISTWRLVMVDPPVCRLRVRLPVEKS